MTDANAPGTGPWRLLSPNESLLVPPDGGSVPEVVTEIILLGPDLMRRDYRIVVAGAIKTGKSALVNSLIQAPIAPMRARKPSRRMAEISFAEQPSARLRNPGGDAIEISFDAARDAILAGPIADMVQIAIPSALLTRGCVLVDTPGFGEDVKINEAVMAEVARADLAIVVLAADKILSAAERATAAGIDALLGGNVVYAVNRLDLVDVEDRAEVLQWAEAALSGSGNPLVGDGRIFPTVARAASDPGVDALRNWMISAHNSGRLDRIAAVSRLARLQRMATQAATSLGKDAASARTHAEDLHRRHEEEEARQRQERAAVFGSARSALAHLQAQLLEAEERFILRSIDDTLARLRTDRGVVPLQVRGAMEGWLSEVTTYVRETLFSVPVSAPPFSLEDWIVRIQIESPKDTPDAIGGNVGEAITRIFDGGKAGREAGAAIGSWIGKTVLGVNAEDAQRKQVDRVARSLLPSLRAETQSYLAGVVVLLDEAERYYAAQNVVSPEVEKAEDAADRAAALFHWAGTLVQRSEALRLGLM